MENNIDDILKDKAFDCMDDKNKQELKECRANLLKRLYLFLCPILGD